MKENRKIYLKLVFIFSFIALGSSVYELINHYIFDGKYLLNINISSVIFTATWATVGAYFFLRQIRFKEETIKNIAITDDMTGIYNRRGFYTLFNNQLNIAERTKSKITILFIDLDGLKKINDVYGHKTGDHAIISFSQILQKAFRKTDIKARIGGDEFLVSIFNPKNSNLYYYQRIKKELIKFNKENNTYYLSASVGFAKYDSMTNQSVEELLRQADTEMYKKKRVKKRIIKTYKTNK